MSTAKQETVLTDGVLFYDQEKNMVELGTGKLKLYASKKSASAACKMIKAFTLTPIALADAKKADDNAKNGKVVEVSPLPAPDDALKEKEAREFAETLQNTYGHITPNKAVQEKIHNFSLSPVGKRVNFNADYIRSLLAEYDKATTDIPTPANKQVLIDGIDAEQAKLETFKATLDADTFGYVAMGIRAKIAPMQKELAELPDESKTVFDALFLLPLCGRLFSEKALKPSTRGKSGNDQTWAMSEGQFLAFDYSSTRTCQNGLDLSKLGLASIQGFIYHPDHENVKSLSIPAGKLAVVTHDHILIGQIDAKQALGNVLGEAIFEVVKPAVDRATFVQAISSTGVDAFQSKKSTILSKTAKTVSAEIVRNGQHNELDKVGNRSDTEKSHPSDLALIAEATQIKKDHAAIE